MKPVISCSRRTDVPAVYFDWLAAAVKSGRARFLAPRGFWREVSLQPEDVHSVVFWSKDYRYFLQERAVKLFDAFNLFFHFTVTGLGGSFWEPAAPQLDEALAQARGLVKRWGSERVHWRFDPIVFWQEGADIFSNASAFRQLAPRFADIDVTNCTVSFAQWYPKLGHRLRNAKVKLAEPDVDARRERLAAMNELASGLGMTIHTCASESSEWSGIKGIRAARCVDGDLLSRLRTDSSPAVRGKDPSQRPRCGCTTSIDIGSYVQPCKNGCLYCYATPNTKSQLEEAPRASTDGDGKGQSESCGGLAALCHTVSRAEFSSKED